MVLYRDRDRAFEPRLRSARMCRKARRTLGHHRTHLLCNVRGQLGRDLTTLGWMDRRWHGTRSPVAGPMIANPNPSDHVVGNRGMRTLALRFASVRQRRRDGPRRAASICLSDFRNALQLSLIHISEPT